MLPENCEWFALPNDVREEVLRLLEAIAGARVDPSSTPKGDGSDRGQWISVRLRATPAAAIPLAVAALRQKALPAGAL